MAVLGERMDGRTAAGGSPRTAIAQKAVHLATPGLEALVGGYMPMKVTSGTTVCVSNRDGGLKPGPPFQRPQRQSNTSGSISLVGTSRARGARRTLAGRLKAVTSQRSERQSDEDP